MRILIPATAAAAAFLSFAWPQVANACSCLRRLSVEVPSEGATDVPTNAVLWTQGSYVDIGEFVLMGADGVAVPHATSVIELIDAPMAALRPDIPLQPEMDYTLWLCVDGVCEDDLVHFRTGTGLDTSSPAVPDLLSTKHDHAAKSVCPGFKNITFTFEVEEGGLLVAAYGTNLSFDPIAFDGDLGAATNEQRLTVGSGLCSGGWPGGDTQTVRFGNYDQAGNFSGWSEPIEESLEGCGCYIGGSDRSRGPSGSAFWLLLALLLPSRICSSRARLEKIETP